MKTWDVVQWRNSRKTVFNFDGKTYSGGAATTRCFEDLVAQRGEEKALEAAAHATELEVSAKDSPEIRGREEFEIVVEQLLLGAGVPRRVVPELVRRCRQGRETGVDIDRSYV